MISFVKFLGRTDSDQNNGKFRLIGTHKARNVVSIISLYERATGTTIIMSRGYRIYVRHLGHTPYPISPSCFVWSVLEKSYKSAIVALELPTGYINCQLQLQYPCHFCKDSW